MGFSPSRGVRGSCRPLSYRAAERGPGAIRVLPRRHTVRGSISRSLCHFGPHLSGLVKEPRRPSPAYLTLYGEKPAHFASLAILSPHMRPKVTQGTAQTAFGLEQGAFSTQHAVPEVELPRPRRGHEASVARGVGVAHQAGLPALPERPANPVQLPTERNVVVDLR